MVQAFPDSKVHGANIEPIWGRQDPGRHHVGPMNFAIWVVKANSREKISIIKTARLFFSDTVLYLAVGIQVVEMGY